jgi:polyhydroxyalkanoate synthesis regulator protein
METIIRYRNRKLYSQLECQYITLNDIEDRVKKDFDFQVIKNDTKEDITNHTILQVLTHSNAKNIDMESIRNMIKASS